MILQGHSVVVYFILEDSIVSYHAILYRIDHIMLYAAILYYSVLYYIMLYYIILHYLMLHYTILYCNTLY